MRSARVKAFQRRQDIRIPIALKVDMEVPNDHYLFEYSTNLSQSGIFIQTDDPLEPGTLVQLQFTLPDAHLIRTRGEVMWVNEDDEVEPGMGIKFMGLSLEDRERILTAIKKIAIL
jgi:type IV pilus assembly protein PilZ